MNCESTSPAALPSAMRRALRFGMLHPRQRAFSLVELTVVMTIMATMLGVGSLMYSRSLLHARINAAATRLAADIRAAQTSARTGSQTVSISFDQGSGTYKIAHAHSGTDATIDLHEEPYRAAIAGVDAGAGTGTLTFNGYGVPDAQAVIKLTVRDLTRRISVEAQTGKVQID